MESGEGVKAVVGGGKPSGVFAALWRLWRETRRWRSLVVTGGGPVVLTLTLLGPEA